MVSRKLRELTDDDIKKISDTYEAFADGTLEDVKGFCAVADTSEIEKQDYILTPGRYVGIEEQEEDDEPFDEKMDRLTSELSEMFVKSHELEGEIRKNWGRLGMSSSNEIMYCLIFDTNALFQAYEKKADFTTFSFNSTFENVIDMINQLDIYNQVTVAIPSVVWSEMEKQIIEKHNELLSTYKSTISKKRFPEYSIQENPDIDYPDNIKNKIAE